MTESPFVTVNAILSEQTNSADDLRIIARDNKRLDYRECGLLESAANDYENLQRVAIKLNESLIEARQQLIALNDRLLATSKKIGPFPPISMSIQGVIGTGN
jgi:hypothetical protein